MPDQRSWIRHVQTEMSSKMVSSNNIAHARRTVQQLRIEANIERIKVSKASADLMHYCGEHAKYDPLLMGIPASENPFKDKNPCTILKLLRLCVAGGKGRGKRKAADNSSEGCRFSGRCSLLSHCIDATPEVTTLPQTRGERRSQPG
ncbi:hypothetical protein SKAU_G00058510 [Synaphobranchus kaupii]|uniref:Guanine nucleotide-binding protein subunit gamma n=1 Tax=Synaphobranchus kaupii TaxID=118154 RepID=A0A9Q1J9D0_SYNKA|nr:hypothetical protein SKAU_G00058510 [Synaphobranchus kaupii]